jgi:ABC-type sugar transport system permease subunit
MRSKVEGILLIAPAVVLIFVVIIVPMIYTITKKKFGSSHGCFRNGMAYYRIFYDHDPGWSEGLAS